ncbi:helix-turn-helix domain-containing protein [Clostridium botulinum]|uniref:helix-turn-helix domain-containing protein n=1 Tax=Clostridium botulinum TaxID=1491 RepID=UPI001FD6DB28|nr:helix-turn-helix domain-containing protein [Clostridium botulinum]MCJ8172538.1 helix-turn-helix domain-containing protein [Clostridium botulinum]
MCNEILKLNKEVQGTGELDLFLSIQMGILNKTLLYNLSEDEFKVFIALATFMNDSGECCPSQETLGTPCNMLAPAANKAINVLLKVSIGDSPILKRELVGKGSTKYSKYRIPKLNEVEISEISTEVGLTALGIIKLFQDAYFQKYSVSYKLNYRVELVMIKSAMLPNYTNYDVRTIIKTIF